MVSLAQPVDSTWFHKPTINTRIQVIVTRDDLDLGSILDDDMVDQRGKVMRDTHE